MSKSALFIFVSCGLVLFGCGPSPTPPNPEDARRGFAFQAEYRDPQTPPEDPGERRSSVMNEQRCLPPRGDSLAGINASGSKHTFNPIPSLLAERVTRGDLLDIRVDEDDTFTSSYVVSRDGTLRLPYLDPIPAQGRAVEEIEADIRQALLEDDFYVQPPRLSVRLMDFAPVRVAVSGAVFEPRHVEIGGTRGDEIDQARQSSLGAAGENRNLSGALRAAGGIRPDSDLSAVELRRGGKSYFIDMRGAITGRPFEDVLMLTGDAVVVPSRACFQRDLMVPSPISPPGVSLFMSNLTQPTPGNASSGIDRAAGAIPYGTRMMQAVVGANCVGGTRLISASRSAALFTRNPMTQDSVVIERRVEDMRARPDRDQYDPWLLPGDSIVCYDSSIVNIADAARVVSGIGAAVFLAD